MRALFGHADGHQIHACITTLGVGRPGEHEVSRHNPIQFCETFTLPCRYYVCKLGISLAPAQQREQVMLSAKILNSFGCGCSRPRGTNFENSTLPTWSKCLTWLIMALVANNLYSNSEQRLFFCCLRLPNHRLLPRAMRLVRLLLSFPGQSSTVEHGRIEENSRQLSTSDFRRGHKREFVAVLTVG